MTIHTITITILQFHNTITILQIFYITIIIRIRITILQFYIQLQSFHNTITILQFYIQLQLQSLYIQL